MPSPQTTAKGTSLIQQYQNGEKQAKNFQLDILEPVFSKTETQILLSLYKRTKKRNQIGKELDKQHNYISKKIGFLKKADLVKDTRKGNTGSKGNPAQLTDKGRKLVKKIIKLHRDMGCDQERETQQ